MRRITGALKLLFAGAAILLIVLVVSLIGWLAGIFWLGLKVLGMMGVGIGGGVLLLKELTNKKPEDPRSTEKPG